MAFRSHVVINKIEEFHPQVQQTPIKKNFLREENTLELKNNDSLSLMNIRKNFLFVIIKFIHDLKVTRFEGISIQKYLSISSVCVFTLKAPLRIDVFFNGKI